jgi:aryl-alcohol dehydrogenase-like predicted oxidoreductase
MASDSYPRRRSAAFNVFSEIGRATVRTEGNSHLHALADLKARGDIAAIGAGINLTGMIRRFLERWPIDFFIVAMPYTLIDQIGLDELDLCAARGVSVVIGAP